MDVGNIPLMSALKQRMKWLSHNQKVVSENVAHADTPGYRAKKLNDIDFSDFLNNVGASGDRKAITSVTMRKTNEKHMDASGGNGLFHVNEVDDQEEKPNGNTVVLEEEMIRMADTQMQYGMMVQLYKKNVTILKSALGKL